MNDISEPVQVKKPTGIPLESIFANEPDVNTVPLGDRWKYWLPPNPELGKETWVIELKSEIAAALYNISEDNVNRIESISFLASDLASFITGVYIPVSGGNVMPAI